MKQSTANQMSTLARDHTQAETTVTDHQYATTFVLSFFGVKKIAAVTSFVLGFLFLCAREIRYLVVINMKTDGLELV
jgi:hypothetical protein